MFAKNAVLQVLNMGEVAVVYKINPELDKKDGIKTKLTEIGAKEIQEEDVGFGITMLKVVFVMEDKPNCMEDLEKKIEAVEGINSIQIEGTTLL